jgi:hypothetical protein
MENPGAVAGLVTAVVALVELVKYLITRFIPPKQHLHEDDQEKRDATRLNVQKITDELPKFFDSLNRTAQLVVKLWEVHDRRDQDGVPVWYVPRSWAETQEKVVENLRQVAELTRRSLELLERIERRNGYVKKT